MTKRQLRRLALQTSRYPSWRPVLQDALLEMYPGEFEHAIRWTEEMSKSDAEAGYYNPYAVVFRPADGRHRAHAAILLDIRSVPVLIWRQE